MLEDTNSLDGARMQTWSHFSQYCNIIKEFSCLLGNTDDHEKSSVIEESIQLLKVVAEMIPIVMVTLGKHGAILCYHGDRHDKFPVRGQFLKVMLLSIFL